MKRIIFALSLIVVLSSCQPDPRKEADAYATHSQADQEAQNAVQTRQHNEELHQQEMQRLQLLQQIREKTANTWVFAKRVMIWAFGISVYVVIAIAVVSIGIVAIGSSRAAAHAAMLKANQIYPDPVTGLFPLLQHIHGNRYALHNPNTGSVIVLDVSRPENAQLISALQVTTVAGVLARSAAKSQDPAGMGLINPPIVHAQQDGIILGADYLKRDQMIQLPTEGDNE